MTRSKSSIRLTLNPNFWFFQTCLVFPHLPLQNKTAFILKHSNFLSVIGTFTYLNQEHISQQVQIIGTSIFCFKFKRRLNHTLNSSNPENPFNFFHHRNFWFASEILSSKAELAARYSSTENVS